MSQIPKSISSLPEVYFPTFLKAVLHAHDPPCCWRHERSFVQQCEDSITAEVRERGGGAVKVYSQVQRVFSRRREGKISIHLETPERRALQTMEWSLRGFKHKKWQDQLRSDWFLPYCSHGASVRRRKRKVGVLWNCLLCRLRLNLHLWEGWLENDLQ